MTGDQAPHGMGQTASAYAEYARLRALDAAIHDTAPATVPSDEALLATLTDPEMKP